MERLSFTPVYLQVANAGAAIVRGLLRVAELVDRLLVLLLVALAVVVIAALRGIVRNFRHAI